MKKRIVIAGMGMAGVQVSHGLRKHLKGREDVEVLAVDGQNFSLFAPMLHEGATGTIALLHLAQPVREVVQPPQQRFLQAEVQGLDREKKVLRTATGDIPYDILVLAMGSRTNFFNVPGAKEHAFPIKTMRDAIRMRSQIIDIIETATKMPKGERRSHLHFVVVGAGYTGVEMAGQLSDLFSGDARRLYPEIDRDEFTVTLVHSGERILPMVKEKSSRAAQVRLERLGVQVKTGAAVTAVSSDGATLSDGTQLASKTVIWASGVMAVGDLFFPAEQLQKGRISVKATLQMRDDPSVFVVGDLAAVTEGNGPHPQTAQAAFEQAHAAARNIKRLLDQEPLEGFYYKHKGDLVPIGDAWAVAEVFGLRFHGRLAWYLRRFVYLRGLPTWSERVRVMGDWFGHVFRPRDTSRL